jgi:hypothetical protein
MTVGGRREEAHLSGGTQDGLAEEHPGEAAEVLQRSYGRIDGSNYDGLTGGQAASSHAHGPWTRHGRNQKSA